MSTASLTGTEQHGLTAHSDGPVVPVQTRNERAHSFDPADFPEPSIREVNWRLSPLDRLAPLFESGPPHDGQAPQNGQAALTIDRSGPAEAVLDELPPGQAPRGEIFLPEDVISANAWQLDARGRHLAIPAGVELDEPVQLTLTGNGAELRASSHLVIEAGAGSKATVLLLHEGAAQLAQNLEIIVREGAKLTLVSLQDWSDEAIHAASHQARVDRDAHLRHIVVSIGGGVVRVNPTVRLAGTGSEADLYGLSFADAGQHLESQVFLFHEGRHTRGDVLYKGALQGKSARTVWIGDVLIGPDAVGTDSYEANRNLLLTEGARADSVPNLEIETGDIVGAGHASATGRFDDEQLFYLQARGIPEDEARRLVVLGFLGEIVQKIRIPALEDELIAAIEDELAATPAAEVVE